jgi:flagellar operon protein
MVVNNSITANINRINITVKPQTAVQKPSLQHTNSFDSILKENMNRTEGLKFSKHAEQRLAARNITLTQVQKDKMNDAVAKAESKGVKDSLVLMDNMAFVVNVRNKTVITAVNSNELKENVFTNIDGAVIA